MIKFLRFFFLFVWNSAIIGFEIATVLCVRRDVDIVMQNGMLLDKRKKKIEKYFDKKNMNRPDDKLALLV